MCELSNQAYNNPYVAFIVKNCIAKADPISIAGERGADNILATTFTGTFDPDDGLTLANSPVEVQIGIK